MMVVVVGRHNHPHTLGRPGSEAWGDAWPVIQPMMEKVKETGNAIWFQDYFLPVANKDIHEERYFTYSYSPIRGETGKVIF